MMKKSYSSIMLVAILLFTSILGGCSSKSGTNTTTSLSVAPRGNTGTITTGQTVNVSNTEVTADGDIIAINSPGDPLNGLAITVPPGAYPDSLTFKVSYAPITKQTFGRYINPISPLITVDNGGNYSEEPIEVKIPVKVPDGYFAMGFYYDATTKQIEGMPMLAFDVESVTVSTRHFSSFFVSMIEKEMLKKDIKSSFLPGVDDWQFINNGSYVTPNGHCAGQSIAAMWYYYAKPDGKDVNLYGHYDNNGNQPATPDLWEDDSLAYRLCSAIQIDYDKDLELKFLELAGKSMQMIDGKWNIVDVPGIGDEATWYLFAYSMLASGQPQLVGVVSNAGDGHALICYRIYQGYLYIADPNYPGNTERRIEYSNGKFKPYNSGSNRAEIDAGRGQAYEKIAYFANWSMQSFDQITSRWNELKNGAVGNELFPPYLLYYQDEEGKSQYLTEGSVISINKVGFGVTINGTTKGVTVYRDGKKLPWDTAGKFELKPGNNKLGFLINKEVGGELHYIDFKYVNVVYSGLTLTPLSLEGEIGKDYTFTATLYEVPAGTVYEWYIEGDLKQSSGSNTFKTAFTKKGDYTVSVWAGASGMELGKAETKVTIKETVTTTTPMNNLTKLQTANNLRGLVSTKSTFTETRQNQPETTKLFDPYTYAIQGNGAPIVWKDTSFSGESIINESNGIKTQTISGTVSPDGNTVLTLTYAFQHTIYFDPAKPSEDYCKKISKKIILQNVPLKYDYAIGRFTMKSSDIQKYVVKLENIDREYEKGINYYSFTSTSYEWNSASDIMVTFEKN
jgi:hypothetical protein